MISQIDKEENLKYIKKYFISRNIKRLLIYYFCFFIISKIIWKNDNIIIPMLIILILGILRYFFMPDFLYKETKEAIEKYYDDNKNDEKGFSLICNIKKLDGPMFGVLEVGKNNIKFIPFKENLKNESFILHRKDININEISIIDFRFSLINRIFFKELYKVIRISAKNGNIFIQAPQIERTLELIKSSLGED